MPSLWEHLQERRQSPGEEYAAVVWENRAWRCSPQLTVKLPSTEKNIGKAQGTRGHWILQVLSVPRAPLTSLCLAGRQVIGHLFKEAELEDLCFTGMWKGLAVYTLLFSFMVTTTRAIQTGTWLGFLVTGPDQMWHTVQNLGHQDLWLRGKKVFLSAFWV